MSKPRIIVLLLAGFLAPAILAAEDVPVPRLKAGQVVCGVESELDQYDAAGGVAGGVNPLLFAGCRRIAKASPITVLLRHGQDRARIKVMDGLDVGYIGWADGNFRSAMPAELNPLVGGYPRRPG
jgi:hypothetical protein